MSARPRRSLEHLRIAATFEVGPVAPGAAIFDRLLELSGEAFPIHRDDAFAARTPVGRRLVSGLVAHSLAEAHVDEVHGALDGTLLEARFDYLAPIHPDDELVIRDTVERVAADVEGAGQVTITRKILRAGGELAHRSRLTYRVRSARARS